MTKKLSQEDKRAYFVIVSGVLTFAYVITGLIWFEDGNAGPFIGVTAWVFGILMFFGLIKLAHKIFPDNPEDE